ncbi:MAG: substrate-binding domain-containing protein [Candidatus Aminicenantes bacterium]|nr:substrate-binding domain-containing protein [Candidatus Aminicenantes bacterium]
MKRTIAVLVLASLLALAGHGSMKAHESAAAKLQGTITISGAWALYPMVVRWSEEFRKLHPNVRFDISAGGAGKGIADALAGMVDFGMVSREIYPAEIGKGAWFIPVTKDAVVPVINRGNPLFDQIVRKGITKSGLSRIWLEEETPTWNELLGGKGGMQIHVYTRSDSCGAAETWALFLGNNQEDLLGIGVFGDPGLSEAVRKDALGIGFNNVNYAYDATSRKPMAGTAVLPVDLNANGKIDPRENFYGDRDAIIKAISEDRYPSPPSRDLYFVCQGRPQRPLVSAFMKWVLTAGQKYVAEAGYIALAHGKVVQALAKLGR